MGEQVHETCEPIRPEDVPAELGELFDRSYSGVNPEAATCAGLAAVLTEATERIAQAIECELAEDRGDMSLITDEGERAAAVARSYPEAFDG